MRVLRSLRRWWRDRPSEHRRAHVVRGAAVAVTAAVYVVHGLAWIAYEEPDDEPTASESPAPPPFLPETRAGDGGTAEVVEVGFTPMEDVAGDDMVSWAATIRNTSSEDAVEVRVVVAVRDGDGDAAETIGGEVSTFPIPPGGSVTVGSTDYVSEPAVDVSARIDGEAWWPSGAWEENTGTAVFSEITTRVVGVGESVPYWGEDIIGAVNDEDGRLRVAFRVEWDGPALYGPGMSMIYRDDDGALLGASDPSRFGAVTVLPPGWSIRGFDVRDDVPEDATLDEFEIVVVRG